MAQLGASLSGPTIEFVTDKQPSFDEINIPESMAGFDIKINTSNIDAVSYTLKLTAKDNAGSDRIIKEWGPQASNIFKEIYLPSFINEIGARNEFDKVNIFEFQFFADVEYIPLESVSGYRETDTRV